MRLGVRAWLLVVLSCLFVPPSAAAAQPSKPSAAPPSAYDAFVTGARLSSGLIGVVRKAGKTFLVLQKAQLGSDFIQTAVPATGLGGFGPAAGEPYVAPARIMRFDRLDDAVVIRWPNTFALVPPGSPQEVAARTSLPASVIGVVPIVAESPTQVVIPADPFLGDVANFGAQFDALVDNPAHGYRLDPTRTFFSDTKALPENTILRVSQTWASASPDQIDNVPDARSVEVNVTYNFIAAPNDGYVPRIADPRVGYFTQPLLDFGNDPSTTRNVYYLSRWNFMPEHPGQPSAAKNPLVFTMSNDIPTRYRQTVRAALLTWNGAFRAIGIQDAVQVNQQPDDPSFDPDDVRHNMVRWIDATSPQYGAEALIVNDPRTGEELNAGINVDAVMGTAGRSYRYFIAPARGLPDSSGLEDAFTQRELRSVILHESGHDLGLQHNFIGSMAYLAKDLQSASFTGRYGVANSVMEYAPLNVWPKGTAQGDVVQLVLGPYDFHAIRYGYEYVANAATPQAELPALRRIASLWGDPKYRFASDEDAFFSTGHAIDPRVQMFDLTNHPLQWEATQLAMLHGVMDAVDRRFPQSGEAYDEARRAFTLPLRLYVRTAEMPANVIGGEYLSRAAHGDPGSTLPLQPVSKAEQYRAWQMLERWMFSDAAWRFNPRVLRSLTYSEVSSLGPSSLWSYAPSARHDVDVVGVASAAQHAVLDELFAPLTLSRVADLSLKYSAGSTISLTDLFDWTRDGIFGEIENGKPASAGVVRRNAQMDFTKLLARLWTAPPPGTPPDAQALARLQLERIAQASGSALQRGGLDEMTRAHLEALQTLATQAANAHATMAAPLRPER